MPFDIEQIAEGLARGAIRGAIQAIAENGVQLAQVLHTIQTATFDEAPAAPQEFTDALQNNLRAAADRAGH